MYTRLPEVGISYAILEAAELGLPVVGLDRPELRDRPGIALFAHAEQAADVILRLVTNESEWIEAAEAARSMTDATWADVQSANIRRRLRVGARSSACWHERGHALPPTDARRRCQVRHVDGRRTERAVNGTALPGARLPALAVIMTAYNAESTVARSIQSAARQEYDGPLRIIVVDDGSTDGTVAEIEALDIPMITLVRSERVGRARALNKAIAEAEGAVVIANLDADDFMLAGRLTTSGELAPRNPKLAAVGSAYYEVHRGATAADSRSSW